MHYRASGAECCDGSSTGAGAPPEAPRYFAVVGPVVPDAVPAAARGKGPAAAAAAAAPEEPLLVSATLVGRDCVWVSPDAVLHVSEDGRRGSVHSVGQLRAAVSGTSPLAADAEFAFAVPVAGAVVSPFRPARPGATDPVMLYVLEGGGEGGGCCGLTYSDNALYDGAPGDPPRAGMCVTLEPALLAAAAAASAAAAPGGPGGGVRSPLHLTRKESMTGVDGSLSAFAVSGAQTHARRRGSSAGPDLSDGFKLPTAAAAAAAGPAAVAGPSNRAAALAACRARPTCSLLPCEAFVSARWQPVSTGVRAAAAAGPGGGAAAAAFGAEDRFSLLEAAALMTPLLALLTTHRLLLLSPDLRVLAALPGACVFVRVCVCRCSRQWCVVPGCVCVPLCVWCVWVVVTLVP